MGERGDCKVPHYLVLVKLRGATKSEVKTFEELMKLEGLMKTFSTRTAVYRLPDDAYYRRSAGETHYVVKDRVLRALAQTRFKEGDAGDGTWAYFVIGPSVSMKYLGFKIETLAK